MHAFDRYAYFTDLNTLKEFSAKPLRKSIRVNTLKTSVDDVRAWGEKKGWMLEPVPWCGEGFFVDRPSSARLGRAELPARLRHSGGRPAGRVPEEREALGKDMLHLVGRIYMQEAASMLPVSLLDPQPGETVLDMSAAPGSKTTQIAARMGCFETPRICHGEEHLSVSESASRTIQCRAPQHDSHTGVIIANDVQEKRLWTLKSSLYRAGATNVIVTKKVGQWFGKHMTERFDRVLCDAPCTAQGTIRKDSDALQYCSMENIGKMASLQRELLESAVHAAKVGGTIVYSTCTLTPEENEEVVLSVLNKFCDQLEVVNPLDERSAMSGQRLAFLQQAIEDSVVVQEYLKSKGSYKLPATSYKLARLWPQTYDTEGFFCAVLRKIAPTKAPTKFPPVRFQESPLPRARAREFASALEEMYGTSFLSVGDMLFERGDALLLATDDVARFPLPVQDYALGIPFATRLSGGRIRLGHETATLRGNQAAKSALEISKEDLEALLKGQDLQTESMLRGDVILFYQGIPVGLGLAKEGKIKNNLPRWMVRS